MRGSHQCGIAAASRELWYEREASCASAAQERQDRPPASTSFAGITLSGLEHAELFGSP